MTSGPALPGKLTDCSGQDPMRGEYSSWKGFCGWQCETGSRSWVSSHHAAAWENLKHLGSWCFPVLASQEVHDISVAIGCDPDSSDISELRYGGKICILADADSDGLHIATLLCALFLKHYRILVEQGHVHIAMPPLFRIDIGKEVYYALDEAERAGILDRIAAENKKG